MDLDLSGTRADATLDRPAPDADIQDALLALLGPDGVVSDPARRLFYSTDLAGRLETAAAVARIADVESLQKVARLCSERGWGMTPRGGGFSYTGGYTPGQPNSVLLDLRPMDRILEINAQDMYVVVEAGCTWVRLHEALKAKGLRTPYWGPMSGFSATVGGALSQGSFFLGSTEYGPLSDSVLGLEVVLADGRVTHTGTWASSVGAPPFMRQYGPDATGLFLNDTGAMGFKTKASLKLIPLRAHQGYGSFAFGDYKSALAAVSAVGRTGLAAECYCWDPYFVRVMSMTGSLGVGDDLRFLLNVVRSGANLFDGLTAAARIALAGRGVFKGDTWLMHVTCDDHSAKGASARMASLRAIARSHGGKEVSPTAPRTMRGTPFVAFNTEERRRPLRNLPVNSISPHSRAVAVADDVYALAAARKAEMEAAGVMVGVIFLAVGCQTVCIEPLLYWDDPENFLHNRVTENSDLQGLSAYADRPQATQLAMELRKALKAIFRRHGCAHVQVGRAYPWAETREETALELLTVVKDHLDPDRLVNRGSLGFEGPTA
jgi:FAD/FMN-containing dehydrogenase